MSNRRLAKWIANSFSPAGRRGRLAVFCYHQVVEAQDPLRAGEPTTDEFAQDIELIREVFTPMSFSEAVAKLASNTLPERAACITFDDGYENNHQLAAPILENAGVPATFFVTCGAVDEGVMWNDLVVEAAIRSGGKLKIADDHAFLKRLPDAASVFDVISAMLAQLKVRPVSERWDISKRLFHDNVSSDLPRLMMTREMVADLSATGFEIGGHTLNHPILKELTDDEARREINGCRDWLKTVIGRDPHTFAYPNGKYGVDFDGRHMQMAADAGFGAAATSDWAVAKGSTNPYRVPRIGPWWRQGRSLNSGLLRSYIRSFT